MAKDSHLDTGFLQKQARENARPGTSRGILMVLAILLITGIGFGIFKGVEFVLGFQNLQHVRNVSIVLKEPKVEADQAIVNVTLENSNAYPVTNPQFSFSIAGQEGKDLLKGTINLTGAVPAADQRTFHRVNLGKINGKPAKLHSNLEKVEVNPPESLPKGFNMKFVDALNAEDKVEALKKLKGIAPDYAPLSIATGLVYERLNNWEDAKKQYEEAVKIDPNLANAHYHLGLVLLREKKNDAGMKALKKAEELDPADPDIKDQIESFTNPKPKEEETLTEEE